MGVFSDQKFEKLDWMTQMTETIDSEINGLIATLPDRIEFNVDSILAATDSNYGMYLSVSNTLDTLITGVCDQSSRLRPTWEEQRQIERCFKFEISENFELNFKTKKMAGSLALVKIVQTLEDDELQKMLGSKGIDLLQRGNWNEGCIPRMNEMLDVIGGCEAAMKNRSCRKKIDAMCARLRDIFRTNEWRIRDMELSNKVGRWIKDYIVNGNLAALTNLCKLKVMTHNNMPIYSIEEEK